MNTKSIDSPSGSPIRRALVTGGTGGIGTAICQTLARQGIQVIATYHKGGDHTAAQRWQAAQQADGYDIQIAFADVAQPDSVATLIHQIQETGGPVQILINNAGITRDSSFKKMTVEHWKSVLTTNLDSVFYVTAQVIPQMIAQRGGRIVNISSINAQKGQFGQANYAAAKAGMHGLTKSLAQEVAAYGITVNTVSPGYIRTTMVEQIPETVRDQILRQIPMGRFGEPAEVAELVAFLCGPTAGFITGANFAINGGHHMC